MKTQGGLKIHPCHRNLNIPPKTLLSVDKTRPPKGPEDSIQGNEGSSISHDYFFVNMKDRDAQKPRKTPRTIRYCALAYVCPR